MRHFRYFAVSRREQNEVDDFSKSTSRLNQRIVTALIPWFHCKLEEQQSPASTKSELSQDPF